MPTRARGFWFCDFCSASFDTPEEAEDHEQQVHQHQLAFDPFRQQQQQPHSHPLRPSAVASAATASAYHQQPLPPHSMPPYSPERQQQHLHPHAALARGAGREAPSPYGFEVAASSGGGGGGASSRKSSHQQPQSLLMRRVPLMDPSSSSSSGLAPADVVACRHLEFTEATTATATASSSALDEQPLTQVGLRCRGCGDRHATQNELSLPRAIRFLADAIRRLADQHLLSHCPQLSAEERRVLQEAQARRTRYQQQRHQQHQLSSSSDQEYWEKEERDRQLLIEFCTMRCQQLGIVNKHPENSGIVFREAAAAASTLAQQQQSRGYEPPMMRRQSAGSGRGPFEGHPMDPFYQQPQSPFESPTSSFPFYQDVDGDWLCRYCCHLHPQYRDVNYRWSSASSTPPPAEYIDHHLSVCRSFLMQQQHTPMPPFHHAQQLHVAPPPPNYPPSPMDFGPPTPVMYHQGGSSYTSPHAYSPQQQQQQQHPPWEHPASSSSLGGTAARREQQRRASSSPPPPYRSQSPTVAAARSSVGFSAAVAASSQSSAGMAAMLMTTPVPSPSHHLPHASGVAVQRDGKAELAAQRAVEFLTAQMSSGQKEGGGGTSPVPESQQLVQDEDKLLLTDFLFYLMKQLQIVRFSEADRKTRGGKREKIQLGFGGLQCSHCKHSAKSRKFFWSGVDRLANSFAEIPAHIFKCTSCPSEIKDALTQVKRVHAEQMARLPRGSQKVFFRRVWKRLHEGDPVALGEDASPSAHGSASAGGTPGGGGGSLKSPPGAPGSGGSGGGKDSSPESKQLSPEGTSGSDESIITLERPTKDAAKALADAAMQVSGPPSPSSRVLLGIAEDRDFLSDTDCYIRRQLEIFCATADDVKVAQVDRKYPVKEGQVGIRCLHCALAKHGSGASGHAVSYPFSINSIFEAVREFQRLHLDYCENLPVAVRSKISSPDKESTTITSIQRKYYVLAAKGLGLRDTKEGIRAGSESVPVVSQAVFAFSDVGSTPLAAAAARRAGAPPAAASLPVGSGGEEEDRLHLMMDPDPDNSLFEFSEPMAVPPPTVDTPRSSRKRHRDDGQADDEDEGEESEFSKKLASTADPGGNGGGGNGGSPF